MASFVSIDGFADGVRDVDYMPAHMSRYGRNDEYSTEIEAHVSVRLGHAEVRARLTLSIEDARILAERLPEILMRHDAAERLASEKAA